MKEVFLMDTRDRTNTGSPRKGGYRRNWAKWIGLYLVVGGIAYLIVYLVAFHHGGGAGGGGGY
jgi:hypothetical protein